MGRRILVSGRGGALWIALLVATFSARQLRATTTFDGYYRGTIIVPGGGDSSPTIAFAVINGVIHWQAPGPTSGPVGNVNPDGSFTVQVQDPSHPAPDLATVTGVLTSNGGSGNTSSPSPPCGSACTGHFTLTRQVGSCSPTSSDLCVAHSGDHEFDITVHYFTTQGGGAEADAHAIDLTCAGVTQGGNFAFFQDTNPEVIVKVLNACAINNTYWVFISAATNVGFTVVVRDTVTGAVVTYSNPDQHAATPVQDTAALPCS
jgi:hypothetical protein